MSKVCLFLIAFVRVVTVCAQPTPKQITTLDSALTKLYERGMLNGVFLLAQEGKAVYKKAFGISNLTTREPLKTTSAFNLASISKQFTGMMIMMLKEKDKLSFDDKVQRHLPEFPYSNITIRHLLNHTSGLPEYFELATQYYNTLDTLTNEKVLQLLKNHQPKLAFEPNGKFSYCNTGYVLLAMVIEKASGMLIQDYFNQQIVKPLGLKDTYLYNFTIKQYPANRVFGVIRENGQMLPNDLVRLDGVSGDGNVYSSVEDLLKWEQALYTEKLVSASTLKEAFTPAKLNDGTISRYGFGWFLDESGKKMSHTGSWVGFLNNISRDIDKKITWIILTSSTDATARSIIKDILEGRSPQLPNTNLIANANLMDGTGTAARRASVRMKDNEIWEIGDLQPFPNEAVTNANGLTLTPGFIDAHSHHFGGLETHPGAEALVSQGITTIVIGQDGGSFPMDTLLSRMNKRPVSVNVATYTGHSTLRSKAMGAKSLYRTAKPEEIEKMKAELKTEMSKGSLGLATGLEYESAFFSNRDEVLQLAKVAAEANGRYISHIRSEDIGLEEALDEIIDIGKQTKMPVQVSHIKIAKRDQWGRSPEVLAKLQKARSEGINITADCYPYDFWNSTLRVLFPKRDYTNLESAAFAVNQLFDPAGSVLVRFAPNTAYAGKTIAEIANTRNEKPAQTLMALIAQAGDFESKNPDYKGSIETIMGKSMSETDVANFLAWPFTGICSDGGWGGHPRGYGAFTRVLGNYVRNTKTLTLETAVYKMTALTAESLGIPNRGLIKTGYFADLVLFDPNTVKDNANIQNSTALSSGIEKVWVNGQMVYQNQQPTGRFSGVFIKSPTPQRGN
ncbi:serine hydrolase [Runella sp.]|uniref:serine hydrolase n=1 Tax=Runella sp. TaxID=1960881 RepID=UPI002620E476|nr:serine hydrolase [Runella sp.]